MAKKRPNASPPAPTQPRARDGAESAFSPQEISAIRRDAWRPIAAFSVAFAIGLYVYASYGGPWIDSLDERIGEIVAARARRLAQADEKVAAAAKFEEALAAHFDDPIQRVWVSHDLARLLVELGRYEEAIGIAESATHLKGENGEAFSIWHKALEELRREEEAFDVTQLWFAWGEKNNHASSMAWAKFREGLHLRKAGEGLKALEAFQSGARIHPEGNIGALLSQAAALSALEHFE